MTIVKKAKLSKGSIRCPFCRGLVGGFQLKVKHNQPQQMQLNAQEG